MDDHLRPPLKGDLAPKPRKADNLSSFGHGCGSKPEPVSEAQAEFAVKPKGAPLRLSRQVGLLLRTAELHKLTVWQYRWLQALSAQLDPQGLLVAVEYAATLADQPQTYRSLRPWLEYLSRPRKGSSGVHRKAKRRIGVGYRDKGSKPDPSKAARNEANYLAWVYEPDLPESWWKEYGMIPLYALREGVWVAVPPIPRNRK